MRLDLVAIPPAVFRLVRYPASVRSVTIPWARRSVMPRLAAMSRMRTSGLWAMHSSARPWLVRKFQVIMILDQFNGSRLQVLEFRWIISHISKRLPRGDW